MKNNCLRKEYESSNEDVEFQKKVEQILRDATQAIVYKEFLPEVSFFCLGEIVKLLGMDAIKREYKYKKAVIIEELQRGRKDKYTLREIANYCLDQLDLLAEVNYRNVPKSYYLMLKVIVLETIRRNSSARKILKEILEKIDPKNIYARHHLALLEWKSFYRPYEAIKILEPIKEDPVALSTMLEILTQVGNIRGGEIVYEELQKLMQSVSELKEEVLLSIKLSCIRFLEKKTIIESGDKLIIYQMYGELISEIPPRMNAFAARVKNSYACFLIDQRINVFEGLKILREAIKTFPQHVPSYDKLVSTLLKSPYLTREEEQDIREYIDKMLNLDPFHYPALLYKAELEKKITDWKKLTEIQYWKKVDEIYKMYQEALIQDSTYSLRDLFHNSIVHHAAGSFLWRAERVAFKRYLRKPSQYFIPSAEFEFRQSIQIEKSLRGIGINIERLPQKIKNHLILINATFGDYLVTKKSKEGYRYLEKAFELSQGLKMSFNYRSANSFVESYIGMLFSRIGELDLAKERCQRAIRLYRRNIYAWSLLFKIHKTQNVPFKYDCDDPFVKCYIGKLFLEYGNAEEKEEGKKRLEKVIELDEKNLEALRLLAEHHEKKKEFLPSLKYYERIARVRKTSEDYYRLMVKKCRFGIELCEMGAYEEGLPLLEECLKEVDKYPSLLEFIKENLQRLGIEVFDYISPSRQDLWKKIFPELTRAKSITQIEEIEEKLNSK
jgi:Tfp pilus assembly protein PilF